MTEKLTEANLCCICTCLPKRLVQFNDSAKQVEACWLRSVGVLSSVDRLSTNRRELCWVTTEDNVDTPERLVCVAEEDLLELMVKGIKGRNA